MNTDALAKIKMLKNSQACLVLGLFSLVAFAGVPAAIMATATKNDHSSGGFFGFCFFVSVLALSGFPFAILAAAKSVKARRSEKVFWNAARPYRILGVLCAMLSFLATFVIGAMIAFLWVNSQTPLD